jgi:undecaprenyl diphosphate synthase
MRLFEKGIPMILPDVKAANGRVVHLGRRDRVSPEARVVLEAAETETAGNAGQVVCLGIDWGGQDQQLRVMERFAREYPQGTIPTPEILRQLSDTHLTDGTDIPEIDLVFRTGGDQRTSDIPNARCAEFYSIGANLPDATTTDFVMGLVSYSKRERRHGK